MIIFMCRHCNSALFRKSSFAICRSSLHIHSSYLNFLQNIKKSQLQYYRHIVCMYSLFAMYVYYFKFSCCFVWQTNNILFLKCLIINSMLLNLIHLLRYDFLWQFLFNSVLCRLCFQFFTEFVTNFNGSSNISFSFISLLLKERIYI